MSSQLLWEATWPFLKNGISYASYETPIGSHWPIFFVSKGWLFIAGFSVLVYDLGVVLLPDYL